jgi:nicotinamidase-related amidase
MKNRIFYDIDTQNDFMNENGALYVPDAESIKPNLRKLIDYARKNGTKIVGSVDAHSENDSEFKFFPPHCVVGTKGQEKFYKEIEGERYFEKQHYDVFTNPEFEKYLENKKVGEAVVYGVATDICVRAAVLGMQKKNVQCYVVEDAIKGIFPDKTKEALEEMLNAGAKFVRTKDVLEGRI